MAENKYISLGKLSKYHEKEVERVNSLIATAKSEANAYAESLAENYDSAGSAATVQGKLDEEVLRAKAAEEAAQAAADKAQSDVDALDTRVGPLPEGTAATSVVDYVNLKTAGIATDAALGELNNQVSGLQTLVNTINGDYLKEADKTELADAIADEADRAKGVESGLETRLKAVEDDHLVAADKTELEGKITTAQSAAEAAQGAVDTLSGTHATDKKALEDAIALKADQTALDTVSAVANAAVKQSDYNTKVKALEDEDARIVGLVEAEAQRAAGVEESLQTQINTIMNNPDAEGAINSINEFTQYVTDHGTIAEGFRVDIDKNAEAITDLSEEVALTYETKEDATAKYDELAAKAVRGNWNQLDPTANDYIKNKTHYAGKNLRYVVWDLTAIPDNSGKLDSRYALEVYENDVLTITVGETVYKCTLQTVDGVLTAVWDGETLDTFTLIHGSARNIVRCKYPYVDKETNYKLELFRADVLVQLDEKFIPDTIARVSEVEALVDRVSTLEGEMDAVEGAVATKVEQSAYDEKVAALEGADTGLGNRITALENRFAGEGSVEDLIATSKQEAIDAAAADATSKANTAEANAKGHADELNTAMNSRVEALEAIDHAHANKAELDLITTGDKAKWDAAAAKAHEHANAGVLDGITAEKVSAWDSAEAGAIAHADGLNTTMSGRMDAVEEWQANMVECTDADIEGLFA